MTMLLKEIENFHLIHDKNMDKKRNVKNRGCVNDLLYILLNFCDQNKRDHIPPFKDKKNLISHIFNMNNCTDTYIYSMRDILIPKINNNILFLLENKLEVRLNLYRLNSFKKKYYIEAFYLSRFSFNITYPEINVFEYLKIYKKKFKRIKICEIINKQIFIDKFEPLLGNDTDILISHNVDIISKTLLLQLNIYINKDIDIKKTLTDLDIKTFIITGGTLHIFDIVGTNKNRKNVRYKNISNNRLEHSYHEKLVFDCYDDNEHNHIFLGLIKFKDKYDIIHIQHLKNQKTTIIPLQIPIFTNRITKDKSDISCPCHNKSSIEKIKQYPINDGFNTLPIILKALGLDNKNLETLLRLCATLSMGFYDIETLTNKINQGYNSLSATEHSSSENNMIATQPMFLIGYSGNKHRVIKK